MNRNNVSERYDFARRVTSENWCCVFPHETAVEVEYSPSDSLLSVIYAVDERTGLPSGDLQYFVSDKANPTVKQFILDNLMCDISSARNIKNPSGLTDDALLELSRGSNETIDDYVLRLGNEIETYKFFVEQSKKDVPDKSE